jgi:hypothetical protein
LNGMTLCRFAAWREPCGGYGVSKGHDKAPAIGGAVRPYEGLGLTGFFVGFGFGVTLAAVVAGSKVHAKRGRRLAAAGRGLVGVAVEGRGFRGGSP